MDINDLVNSALPFILEHCGVRCTSNIPLEYEPM